MVLANATSVAVAAAPINDWFGMVLFGAAVVVCVAIVGLFVILYMYFKRMRISYVVFMPNKKIVRATSKEGADHMIINGCNYFYDESKCFYNGVWGKQVHYYYNNPYAIDYYNLDFKANYESFLDKEKKAQWKNPLIAPRQSLNGHEQHSMLHSHLISELFLSENGLKIIMFLCVAIIIGLIVLGFVNHPHATVCLGYNETINACKAAIKGTASVVTGGKV